MPDAGPSRSAPTSPLAALRKALGSDLARKTGWALLGELARFGSAALAFILLARFLGSSSFGRYAGALAFVSIFFPFATLGGGQLLIMAVARQPETFPSAWRDALRRATVGGLVTVALAAGLAPIILPKVGVGLVVVLAVAEMFGTSVVELSAQAFQAHHQLRSSSLVRATLGLTRLAALGGFAVAGGARTAEGWMGWHLGSSLIAAAIAVLAVTAGLGRPGAGPSGRAGLLEGLAYSFSLSAAYIQDDMDKTLVLRYEPASVAGFYTAGYRFFNIGLLPLRSFLTATLPRFFKAGEEGLEGSTRLARRLLRPGLVYGAATAVLCLAVAPVIPTLLGESYSQAVTVLRALALLPALRVLQFIAGDALTGAGFQRHRTTAQLVTCALNVSLNVALIPRYSWRGAVAATLISEVLLVVSLWFVIGVLRRKGRAGEQQSSHPQVMSGPDAIAAPPLVEGP